MIGLLRMAALRVRSRTTLATGGNVHVRRLASRFAVLAALTLLAATPQHAQKGASKTQKQNPQQPGSGAQVHAGTSSGLDTDTRLMNMLADHQFILLEAELDALPPWQAQYYRGILANRNNDLQKSIELLEPIVDQISSTGNVERERVLRKALAEDYLRQGNWPKAAEAYETLESRLGSKLSTDQQDEIEMPVKMTPLAKDHPAMTVDPCAPIHRFHHQRSPRPHRYSRLCRLACAKLDL